jgi:hypothetical protein
MQTSLIKLKRPLHPVVVFGVPVALAMLLAAVTFSVKVQRQSPLPNSPYAYERKSTEENVRSVIRCFDGNLANFRSCLRNNLEFGPHNDLMRNVNEAATYAICLLLPMVAALNRAASARSRLRGAAVGLFLGVAAAVPFTAIQFWLTLSMLYLPDLEGLRFLFPTAYGLIYLPVAAVLALIAKVLIKSPSV